MFANEVLRKIFEHKRNKVIREWRKLHSGNNVIYIFVQVLLLSG